PTPEPGPARRRANPVLGAKPIAAPIATRHVPSRNTRLTISARLAPSAKRMPNSRVLCATRYDMIPYRPTTDSTSAVAANTVSNQLVKRDADDCCATTSASVLALNVRIDALPSRIAARTADASDDGSTRVRTTTPWVARSM